jgi:hypothetical protein
MSSMAWWVASAAVVVSGVGVVVAVSVGEIANGVGVAVGLLQLPRSTRPKTAIKVKCTVRFTLLLITGSR